jgi:hypothetical protein
MTGVILFRNGRLNNEQLGALIKRLPGSYVNVNGSNTKPIMDMLNRRATSAKTETKMFLVLSLQHWLRSYPKKRQIIDCLTRDDCYYMIKDDMVHACLHNRKIEEKFGDHLF